MTHTQDSNFTIYTHTSGDGGKIGGPEVNKQMQTFTNNKPTMVMIASYRLTERCPLQTVENILSLICTLWTNVRSNLERCTDLPGGCTGLYFICCCLTVLQRCHNSGESSSSSSLWAFLHLQAKPHASHLQPLLLRCSEEWHVLTLTTLQVQLFYLRLLSFSLLFLSNVSEVKAVSSSHSICTYKVVWRNQMPKPLNVNIPSTSQDI